MKKKQVASKTKILQTPSPAKLPAAVSERVEKAKAASIKSQKSVSETEKKKYKLPQISAKQ